VCGTEEPRMLSNKIIETPARSTLHSARGMRDVLIGVMIILATVVAPLPALADECPGAPKGITTTCAISECNVLQRAAGLYGDIIPSLKSMTGCPNNGMCCIVLDSDACNMEAIAAGNKSGSCKDACAGADVASKNSPPTCPAAKKCCYMKASAGVTGSSVTLPDPLAGMNFPQIVGNIVRAFAGIAGSIALLMFVWGGITYIMSGGVQEKVKKSKATLLNAAIGIVLILCAYTFVSAIIDTILAPNTTPPTTQGTVQGQ
jgi:hypothetical protein